MHTSSSASAPSTQPTASTGHRALPRCYACDAPSVGTRDRRPEGGVVEVACRRHADDIHTHQCHDCGVRIRAISTRCARCLALSTLTILESRVRILRSQIGSGVELHILHGCMSAEVALEQMPSWWDESESLLTDEEHERVIAAVQALEDLLASQGREPVDYRAIEERMESQGRTCGGPGREAARATMGRAA